MTGTDLNTLLRVLNIVVCSFADRGAEIEGVKIIYPHEEIVTPELEYERIVISKSSALKILGFEMNDDEIEKSLYRLGYRAKVNGDAIEVIIPPYRMDILHSVDIVEDIAKGYGYDSIPKRSLSKYNRGSGFNWAEKPRLIMIGLGFLEVTTLTLSSFKNQYDAMRLKREEKIIVDNPVSEYTETLRTWIIPSLMEILMKNKHHELPQRIFEVGYVRGNSMERHLAFLYEDAKASFTNAKSITERILHDLGVAAYEIREKEHPSFIGGRCASIIIGGEEAGIFGEIHPEVLENFEIGYPVVGGEICLDKINKVI